MTRRGLIKGSVGTAATLLVGCHQRGCGSTPVPRETRRAEVVIVGAGLSGLMAARALVKAGVDSVLVVEARDRVGGLTLSLPLGEGTMLDGGGEWVSPEHTRVKGLIEELGLELVESFERGVPVFFFEGVRSTGILEVLNREEREELAKLYAALDGMAAELPLDAPWNAPRAAEYDNQSMFAWLRENTATHWGMRMIERAINFTYGVEPEDISLLAFLAQIRGCGSVDQLMPVSAEGNDKVVVGGAQRISIKMAEELGDRVILGSPVTRIVDEPSRPVVVETDRLAIEAERVIVAMMPADTRRIKFEPDLPAARSGLVARWKGVADYKVHVVYKTSFWRDLGMSGTALGDGKAIDFAFDASPLSGTPGVLVAFGAGEELPSDLETRHHAVTEDLANLFGKDAKNTTGFIETDWLSEKWSSGCASALRTGVLTSFGQTLREPSGRIHWSGTDTSPIWSNFMEGAVRSGERVASEVAALVLKGDASAPPAKSG
ncbi:flavin monoamine oxidase family protein [Sorangium sp. So ce131]|uniref:flavin monoamine oxidase family protein n=1 Tax=Sorangium sp. So ce131 TaxID=3133282 RepID=UPI003F5F117B